MTTNATGWLRYFGHARKALSLGADGVVTCFPQLAMCAGLLNRFRLRRVPIVAYHFNIGTLAPGLSRRLARVASPGIDIFVVHSPSEIRPYAEYLGISEERFRFLPVQRADYPLERKETRVDPYILAMGSAHRDYGTLIEALEPLRLRTIIVTRKDIIATLPTRPWIEYRYGLSAEACRELLAAARLSVTPVANTKTASGQITFVMAMRLGVPIIATRCPGTDGYVDDDRTGLLVPPFDAEALRARIELLWTDSTLREALSKAAAEEAEIRFTDEALAKELRDLLLSFY